MRNAGALRRVRLGAGIADGYVIVGHGIEGTHAFLEHIGVGGHRYEQHHADDQGEDGGAVPAAVAFEIFQSEIALHAEEPAGQPGGFYLPGIQLDIRGLPDGVHGREPGRPTAGM